MLTAAVDDAVSAIFPCYFRCFLLPVLPRAVVASAACTCKCQKIIHTHRWQQQQMEITHTVRVPAKQMYCAPFTTVCCCFCPFVRPFACCFVRLVLFSLSLARASVANFCWFIFVQLVRILFAFFHRTYARVCMCKSVILQNWCRVFAFFSFSYF